MTDDPKVTPDDSKPDETDVHIVTDALTEATPPQRKRRQRSDKGTKRGRRKKDDTPEPIPLKFTLIAISTAYAERSGDMRFIMTDAEATDIENGFNRWQQLRIPELQEYLPETYLVLPLLSYIMRVQLQAPVKPKVTEKIVKEVIATAKDKTTDAKSITDISQLREIPIDDSMNESRAAHKGKFTAPKPKPKKTSKKK